MNGSQDILRPEVTVHPAEMLRQLLEQTGLTQEELAERLEVSRYSVNQLANRRRSVTAEMALRLAKAFSTSPQFWLNLQMAVDLAEAWEATGSKIEMIEPVREPVRDADLFEDID